MKTAEEILMNELTLHQQLVVEEGINLKAFIIDAMKLYANAKLDEALSNKYEIEDEVPFKVVDVYLIKSLKDKI